MGGFPAARCTSASCRQGSGEMRALQPQGMEPCGRTMEGWAGPKWSWSQMELGKVGSCLVSTSPELPWWKTRQWGTRGPDIPCTALFPLASRWVDEGRRGAARLREVRCPSGVRREGCPGGAQSRGEQRGQRPPWRRGHPLCCGSEQSAGAPPPAHPEQIPTSAWCCARTVPFRHSAEAGIP